MMFSLFQAWPHSALGFVVPPAFYSQPLVGEEVEEVVFNTKSTAAVLRNRNKRCCEGGVTPERDDIEFTQHTALWGRSRGVVDMVLTGYKFRGSSCPCS